MSTADSLLSIGGLASGIDTNSLIDGLVAIERQSVNRLQKTQDGFNLSISSWGSMVTNLTTMQRKSEALSDPDLFDKFTLSSSNEDILTIEGKDGGSPGSFAISVFQTARNEKIMSKTYASQTSALGISGDFSVNVNAATKESDPAAADVSITVNSGDSLKDIANKINGAANIGISASIVKLSDTEYSLILTSVDSGAQGASYTQTTGTVLQDLGILNSTGGKGNVAQKLQSSANLAGGADITAATLFSAIDGGGAATNDTITIQGMDRNGNPIKPRNFIIEDPATQTVGDLLKEIENAYNGMVTATVENGRIMVKDKSDGRSSLQVQLTANNEGGGALNFGGMLSVNTAGKNGTLQVGQDAFFSVDNLFMSSHKNEAGDSVQGITIKMKKADITETVTAAMSRDQDAIQKNVQDFVDSFNSVVKYINEQTKVDVTVNKSQTDTDTSTKDKISKGPLAGDSTVARLKSELASVFTRQHDELKGATYTSLASIGIELDPYTDEYKIDSTKFKAALNRNYDNVKQLFVKTGTADDANFTFGMSTKDTQSGRYKIDVDAKTVSLLDRNDNVVNTYNATLSDVVLSVSETGSAQGLALTVPLTGSAVFTFSKGVGLEIADFVKKVTDPYDGFITLRTQGLQDRIKEYDTKISDQNDRVTTYQNMLKAQFAAMEQTMSRLRSQSGQMMSALG